MDSRIKDFKENCSALAYYSFNEIMSLLENDRDTIFDKKVINGITQRTKIEYFIIMNTLNKMCDYDFMYNFYVFIPVSGAVEILSKDEYIYATDNGFYIDKNGKKHKDFELYTSTVFKITEEFKTYLQQINTNKQKQILEEVTEEGADKIDTTKEIKVEFILKIFDKEGKINTQIFEEYSKIVNVRQILTITGLTKEMLQMPFVQNKILELKNAFIERYVSVDINLVG